MVRENRAAHNSKWANLLRLEPRKKNKGRVFMDGKKEAKDEVFEVILMNAQVLRENVARILKDETLLNLIVVRDKVDLESRTERQVIIEIKN